MNAASALASDLCTALLCYWQIELVCERWRIISFNAVVIVISSVIVDPCPQTGLRLWLRLWWAGITGNIVPTLTMITTNIIIAIVTFIVSASLLICIYGRHVKTMYTQHHRCHCVYYCCCCCSPCHCAPGCFISCAPCVASPP